MAAGDICAAQRRAAAEGLGLLARLGNDVFTARMVFSFPIHTNFFLCIKDYARKGHFSAFSIYICHQFSFKSSFYPSFVLSRRSDRCLVT